MTDAAIIIVSVLAIIAMGIRVAVQSRKGSLWN
jgi:hypothetical protein